MSNNRRWVLGVGLTLLVGITTISTLKVFGQGATVGGDLSGYAWSSNVGWVNFKGNAVNGANSNYGVEMTSDGKLNKYAWSSNIGWINFNPSTNLAAGDSWPTGATNLHGGELDAAGTSFTGWARACSVFKNDTEANRCKGELRPSSDRGGWDGWISLNCLNTSCALSNYKVSYDQATGQLGSLTSPQNNFAWGSDVVGWISFCGTNHCVRVGTLDAACNAVDSSGNPVNSVDVGVVTKWKASITSNNGVGPYRFCWGNGDGVNCGIQGAVGDVNFLATNIANPDHTTDGPTYSAGQTTGRAAFVVTDSTGRTGTNSCFVSVADLSISVLHVYVNGGDDRGDVDAGSSPAPISGAISDCRTSSGSCTATYGASQSVTLNASPAINTNSTDPLDPNYHYAWSEPSCAANTSCVVNVGVGNKDVTVIFVDQTAAAPSFTVSPGVIAIEFHNAGQEAQSNEATLTLNSGEAVELCTDSFNSFTGNSIRDIINSIPGSHQPVECVLGGNRGSCSSTPPNCTTINPGGQTTFSVIVPEKLIQILNNSPYFIKLRAGTTLVPIRFEYRVRDIRP
ncbi:MAG: hypothetical protein AAB455_00795 [Patescibacteria group bacterium]